MLSSIYDLNNHEFPCGAKIRVGLFTKSQAKSKGKGHEFKDFEEEKDFQDSLEESAGATSLFKVPKTAWPTWTPETKDEGPKIFSP
mmetsp:Transcript_19599/g.30194  ORF Transcript_19599/g.30194 Transcript_19599/m.30194 type:complete len:86 (+) Transcript_19599:512-769(+)